MKIDEAAILEILLKELMDTAEGAYPAMELEEPTGEITTKRVGVWIWVKYRASTEGASWNHSTDRLKGDPYEAMAWRDWIGLVNTAPSKVSSPEALDAWALYKTEYLREYTDVGIWGRHSGSWVEDMSKDGEVKVHEVSLRTFHDVEPITNTKVETVKLER